MIVRRRSRVCQFSVSTRVVGLVVRLLVRCLSVLNVHFGKKSPKLAQMTFDRYLSNPDIGRTFWGGLAEIRNGLWQNRYGCIRVSFMVFVSKLWYSGVPSWNMIILS